MQTIRPTRRGSCSCWTSNYDAKRTGDIFLAMPELVIAPTGLFDRWLASTGKLGGQRKVPRLNNNRDIIDQMLALIAR